MDFLAFQQVPYLRFERQQRVLAFEIRPAADFRAVALHPLAQRRQAFGLLLAQALQEGGAGDEVEG